MTKVKLTIVSRESKDDGYSYVLRSLPGELLQGLSINMTLFDYLKREPGETVVMEIDETLIREK